ncbi:hypothetical protein Peur_042545 [Populus x canadensis]
MKFSWVVISGRPMKKFESGYTVETVFDGSKFGIEPSYSVQVLPSGEFFFFYLMGISELACKHFKKNI